MLIRLHMAFDERRALSLLSLLAESNAQARLEQPDLPLLYDSGITYQRERGESWRDYQHMLLHGEEDCDSLAPARAGEILALGHRAFRPGDPGWEYALEVRPEDIPAEVFLRTRSDSDGPGLYHVLVRYQLGGKWVEDDPSLRLGMHATIDPAVLARWAERGVTPRAPAARRQLRAFMRRA